MSQVNIYDSLQVQASQTLQLATPANFFYFTSTGGPLVMSMNHVFILSCYFCVWLCGRLCFNVSILFLAVNVFSGNQLF